jgi:hypothetical protein
VKLDLSWIKQSEENTLNSMISPTRINQRDSFHEGNSRVQSVLAEVPTTDIFIRKYNNKLKKIKTALNPVEKISSNSIKVDQKLLEKMILLNEELNNGDEWEKGLIIELTNLFLNSYNYSIFLS